MKRICVFCGSKIGNNPVYADGARRLGRLLVEHGLGLVYGGGHIGLMGVLADAVLATGGEVIGVIPQQLKKAELAHSGATEMHVVDTMHQRKAMMADLADGFIAMPGGIGTAEELFEILTWAQLRLHTKPVGLLNVAGYFDAMLAWIDHMIAEGFLKGHHRTMLLVAEAAETLLEKIVRREAPPQELPKWT
jgi:uncharacterized protein (TIGR00730 family)